MNFVKVLNSKAVVSSDENDFMVPEGVYICAVYFEGDIRFYGSEVEGGLVDIAKNFNGEVETISQAKSVIDNIGCRFLNGNLVTN